MHLFRLNWTFKLFDTSLLTKRKLTCNLGTCNPSLIWIWLILPFRIIFTTIDPIPKTLTTFLSPKSTLRGAIISCVKCGPMWSHVFGNYTLEAIRTLRKMVEIGNLTRTSAIICHYSLCNNDNIPNHIPRNPKGWRTTKPRVLKRNWLL